MQCLQWASTKLGRRGERGILRRVVKSHFTGDLPISCHPTCNSCGAAYSSSEHRLLLSGHQHTGRWKERPGAAVSSAGFWKLILFPYQLRSTWGAPLKQGLQTTKVEIDAEKWGTSSSHCSQTGSAEEWTLFFLWHWWRSRVQVLTCLCVSPSHAWHLK